MVVRSWVRRVRWMRWSATTSALAAVVALFGATAVASSLVADRQPSPSSSSSVAANLASVTSDRASTTTAPRVATTRVEDRPAVPTTTTTTSPVQDPTVAPPAMATIVGLSVGADTVTFGTTVDPSGPCDGVAGWTVPRVRLEAMVVVSDDGRRLEERDPSTGEVLGVLATWDEAAGRPVGDGVSEAPPPGDCAPEAPAEDAPSSTVAG